MSRILAALAAAALLTSGCGYIGEPLPPLANIPARVSDLAAAQRGSRMIVQFTLPLLTTEGVPIEEPLKLDLRIGLGDIPFNENEWAAHAKPVPGGVVKTGIARYEIPTAEWTGKDAIVAVRSIGANRKASGWSPFVVVPVVAPPDQPADVTPTSTPEGIHLTWRARGQNYRVFRKTEADTFALVATVQQPQWTDPNTEFGRPYTYQVLSVVKVGDSKEAESDLSAEITFTAVDKFPPAAPSGLHPSAAPNSIELTWDRNTEPDLAGYRIYRAAAGGGALEKIADVSQIPSYSDRNVEHGKTYRYAITAFDQAGNESAKTPEAPVLLP